MTNPVPDKDVHISLEDQQKINKFARHNQKMEELKDELKARQNEIQTLTDATGDVEEFSITADEGEKIPFQIGEVFVMEAPDAVLELIEAKKAEVEGSVKDIEAKMEGVKGVMTDLKTHLYAKFGDAINLEAED
eukprot:TRINITY_DN220_c1_g1_i1.p1 TRINITY_DN220_c1_g1~~TRINITY_DN220_c1_g1_i1.p1  ORF type:complete len:134 (+),score=49.89 TRINITY_DN220_c1_g1_i1:28-429(+)